MFHILPFLEQFHAVATTTDSQAPTPSWNNSVNLSHIFQPSYIGCFLFAVTSIVATVWYLCYHHRHHKNDSNKQDDNDREKKDDKTNNRNDNQDKDIESTIKSVNPVELSCKLAQDETSFLSYLRKLDQQTLKGIYIPRHCRTIDFYLSCKDDINSEDTQTSFFNDTMSMIEEGVP